MNSKKKFVENWGRLGMKYNKFRFDEITLNYDKKRIPLSAMERTKCQGIFRYFGAQGVIDYVDDYIFDGKYLLIAEDGENLKSKRQNIAQIVEGKFWVNNHAHIVQCNEKCILEYLAYLINGKDISGYITGSAQPKLSQANLNAMKFDIPSIKEQQDILSVLLPVEQKIRINKRINNNLEQQAQAIFKEWFIDNPENNEWSTGTFSELIKSTLNGDWGKEAPTGNNTEKVYCIRGADIPEVKAGNKGKMPTRYILPKNFATKQLTAGDIVVEISGGSPTQSTGRCTAITQSLLDRYDSGMVCTNFCKAMKPKEGYSLFIYYYWQYLYGKGVFFSYENGTTGIKNLDFSGFIETETILIPPVDKVIAFDDYCKSIFNQIFANGKQNEHLAILRDTLLPKLMSGELDVSDIDL